MIRKLINKIYFWFCHSTVLWIKVDILDNVILRDSCTIFDRVLPIEEIQCFYTTGVIDDNLWHHIGIVFRRFGKQEFYLDGHRVTNDHFK